MQHFVFQYSGDSEQPSRGQLGDAVLDGILNQRLQQHNRYVHARRVGTNIHLNAQPILETH